MVGNKANCEDVWREISNYIDGDMDAALRSAMEEHFKTCKRCASVLAGTQNVVRLYGDERMLEVPAGFSRRLEKRLTQGSLERSGRWPTWFAWLVPVAAMALIAGGVLLANSITFRSYIRSQHAEPAKNIPPDMVVVVSSGAKLFHVPGCEFIHDKASERTLTAKVAMQEGYVPCPRCLRQYLKTGLVGPRGEDASEDREEAKEERQESTTSQAGAATQ